MIKYHLMIKKGFTQVYTGDGKGKTTAALGMALRSWGHGGKVCVIQFMKQNPCYGECRAAVKLGRNFVMKQFGRNVFVKGEPSPLDIKLARAGLAFARKTILENKYDLVILDEINCALYWGLVKDTDVKEIIKIKPDKTELVLTGRYAPRWLTNSADLVTEMAEKKHYFRKGVGARRGVEY